MIKERISSKLSCPSKYAEVYGAKMHYLEAGSGDPILLLHGIPTSSYLWRNIIPHLAPLGRCIAPDLIGFGKSDKPDIQYTIQDHIQYLEKFIETLNLRRITLIMHDWGSVVGLDYAMRHEKNCKGLVMYEAFLRSYDEMDIALPLQEQFLTLDALPYDVGLNGASYVDKIIPQHVMRELSEEEMNYYREPFLKEGAGKPIAQYLEELPKGDGKGVIDEIIADYSTKLTESYLPKLLLYSIPGFITTMATVMWAKENLPNLEIVDIGEELHLAQESNPTLIGEAISVWLQGIEQYK